MGVKKHAFRSASTGPLGTIPTAAGISSVGGQKEIVTEHNPFHTLNHKGRKMFQKVANKGAVGMLPRSVLGAFRDSSPGREPRLLPGEFVL